MTEVELREQIMLDANVLTNPYWQGQRITSLLNQMQRELQVKLIKQGSRNWREYTDISAGDGVILNIACSVADLPADFLYSMPLELVTHSTFTKPAREIESDEWYETINNDVLTPTLNEAVFMMRQQKVFVYPKVTALTTFNITYHLTITDLVFEDDATECELPIETQHLLIASVIALIKSAENMEQITQAIKQDIMNEIAQRYQLEQIKPTEDRESEL